MENRFNGKSIEEVQERFYQLLEEMDVASMDDSVPAKVLAEMYRELADCIEMIGDLEENVEG